MELPDLTIVIPTYNEASRIRDSLSMLYSYLLNWGIECQIIVVNDPGSDETPKIVKEFMEQNKRIRIVLLEPGIRLGKGGSLRVGVEKAESQIVLFIDADLPTELSTMPSFYRLVKDGADFVLGTRGKAIRKEPLIRHILSTGFHLLFVSLFQLDYDTQCGVKCLRKSASLEVFEHVSMERLTYDVDFIVQAHKRGYKIRQLEIPWYYRSSSTLRIGKTAFRMFLDLLAIWFKNLVVEPWLTENEAEIARFYNNVEGDVRFRAARSIFLPRRFWYGKKFSKVMSQMLQSLESKGSDIQNLRALDVGFGSGDLLERLVGVGFQEPIGIELSKSSVNFLRSRSGFCIPLRADARKLPFVSKAFDVILCIDVLEHLRHPEECLSEILRLLKEGGVVVVTTPAPSLPWYFILAIWTRVRREKLEINQCVISRNRLIYLFTCAGFQLEKLSSINLDMLSFFVAKKRTSLGAVNQFTTAENTSDNNEQK